MVPSLATSERDYHGPHDLFPQGALSIRSRARSGGQPALTRLVFPKSDLSPVIEYKATSALGALDLEPPSAPLGCAFSTCQGGPAPPRSKTRKCGPRWEGASLSIYCSLSLSFSLLCLCLLCPLDPQHHNSIHINFVRNLNFDWGSLQPQRVPN